jgi:hypothetical protein
MLVAASAVASEKMAKNFDSFIFEGSLLISVHGLIAEITER